MRIALLDDDPDQAELACQVLRAGGYACHVFSNGRQMLDALGNEAADMLVIHGQTGDGSAAQVLAWAHARLPAGLPILFISGRADEDAITAALDAGASDYLVKPVRRGELLTRVRTLLRRAYRAQHEVEQLRFGPYAFQPHSGRLQINGHSIDLTQKEFELALLFFRHLGRPLSRAYILEAVWPRQADVPSRTMDTHVSRVRNKLGLRPENGFRLSPVYSYGYQLEQLSK